MLTCAWHRPGAQGRGLPVASTVLPKPEFPLSAPEVGGGPLLGVIVHTPLWSPEAPLHSPWGYIHTHGLSCEQGQASLGIPAFQKKILSFQEAQRLPRPPAGQSWRKTPAWACESPNTKLGHLSRVSGHIPVLAGAREGTRKGDGGREGQPQGKLEETAARQRPGPDSPCRPR